MWLKLFSGLDNEHKTIYFKTTYAVFFFKLLNIYIWQHLIAQLLYQQLLMFYIKKNIQQNLICLFNNLTFSYSKPKHITLDKDSAYVPHSTKYEMNLKY